MLTRPFLFFLDLLLIFLPLHLQLLLLLARFFELDGVGDGSVKGCCGQARLILEGDRHERAQPRHSVEVHARLSHNFLDEDVLELTYNVVRCISTHVCLSRLAFTVRVLAFLTTFLRRLALGLSGLSPEDGVSDALIVLKELATHELVALARIKEANELAHAFAPVNVSLFIVSLSDRFSWTFQTADINASCWASVVLQELSKVIQLVTKVMCSLIFDFE